MKVLQINATYGFGSTGIIMRDIGTALISAGEEAYFAYQKTSEQLDNGYRVGNLFDHKRHAVLCRLFGGQGFYSRKATKKLCKYIDRISPDIVHLHNLHSNYLHLTLLLEYLSSRDIPTVITMHDCWFFTGKCFHYADVGCEGFKNECGNCPKRKSAPKSIVFDRSKKDLELKIKALTSIPELYLVGCSDWVCNEARKSRLSKCDIRRIYNGVDVSVFTPQDDAQTKSKLGLSGKKIIMGMANKWLLDSNKQLLERTIEGLSEDHVLLIAGCTEEQKKILAGYRDKVYAVGFTSDRKELACLYSMAEVFVNPTHADTLPTVNMESVCSGTPVVTYDVGGSPELINEQSGIVVATGDIDSVQQTIGNILEKDKISCSDIGKQRFNKDESYREYIELYRQICLRRGTV